MSSGGVQSLNLSSYGGYSGHIVPPIPDILCHIKQM